MDNYVKKTPVKIALKLSETKNIYSAFVHLSDSERLQDLVNDDRIFIPIYFMVETKDIVNYRCVLINKSNIYTIEEWWQNKIPLKEETEQYNILKQMEQ